MFLYILFWVCISLLAGLVAGFLIYGISDSHCVAVVSGGVVFGIFSIALVWMSVTDMQPTELKCSGIESTGGYSVCQLGGKEVRIAGRLGTKTMNCTPEDYGSYRLICYSGTEKTVLVAIEGKNTYDMWEEK